MSTEVELAEYFNILVTLVQSHLPQDALDQLGAPDMIAYDEEADLLSCITDRGEVVVASLGGVSVFVEIGALTSEAHYRFGAAVDGSLEDTAPEESP